MTRIGNETAEQEQARIVGKLRSAREGLSRIETLLFYAHLAGFLAVQVDEDLLDEGIEHAFKGVRQRTQIGAADPFTILALAAAGLLMLALPALMWVYSGR